MANIDGTITDVVLLSAFNAGAGTYSARANREVWLVSASFAAYTGASDVARILAVGAGISAKAKDGATRTIAAAAPGCAGADTANQAVFFTGTAAQAPTVATDDLTGQLSTSAAVELTTATASSGVQTIVVVDVT